MSMNNGRQTLWLVSVGVALETATIYAYCLVGRAVPSLPAKAATLAVFLMLMTALLGRLVERSGFRSLLWAIPALALAFVAGIELFAWTLFPGLRHDLVPLSAEHLARMAAGLGLSLSGLAGLALLAASIRRVARRLRAHSR